MRGSRPFGEQAEYPMAFFTQDEPPVPQLSQQPLGVAFSRSTAFPSEAGRGTLFKPSLIVGGFLFFLSWFFILP